MGLLSFIRRIFSGGETEPLGSASKSAAVAKAQTEPGLSETDRRFVAKLEALKKPIIACIPDMGATPQSPVQSRFGGSPAWPRGEDILTGADGRPMIFLAQINYSEAPPLEGYPSEGLLQIFVEQDDLYGCEFPSFARKGFAAIYRENLDGLVVCNQYPHGLPEEAPISEKLLRGPGAPFRFETGVKTPSFEDPTIEADLGDIAHQPVSNAVWQWAEALRGPEIYYGGYPRFTQTDIRIDGIWSTHVFVILQLGMTDDMMWGDAGEACFLMRRDDLEARRFERAIYNWDCC